MFLTRETDEVGNGRSGVPAPPQPEPESGDVRSPGAAPCPARVNDLGPQGRLEAQPESCNPDASTVEWRNAVIALIPPLRAFAWSLSRNSADADDLVQDTLIKAWTHKEKFEPGTNLRAWLFTILRNTYYTAVVKRRREVADEDGKHAARLSTAPTQDWSVAMKAMQAAMQRLPPEHREALILVGAAGLTYEEAAEICGCALGTIKSRVNRARARLLRIMDAEDATDALVGGADTPPNVDI
jgi:RNA polymerase sigma-70 factor (ECF subfamily)